MKKSNLLILFLFAFILNNYAQKLIPFQYQSKNKWDNNAKWGLMNEGKKIVIQPLYYTYTAQIVTMPYMFLGNSILETNTGKIVWDSIETKNVAEVKGNLAKIRMPLRGAVNYQPYSFKNIKSKKTIAEEGEFSKIENFIISYKNGIYGVVNEDGKVIVPPVQYNSITSNKDGFFVATNDYEGYCFIYNTKGEKLNSISYKTINTANEVGKLSSAIRKSKSNLTSFEYIIINKLGMEIGPHFFTKKEDKYLFKLTPFGNAISNTKDTLFKDASCTPDYIFKKNIIINSEGKIIVENDAYELIEEISDGVFNAVANENSVVEIINKDGKLILSTKDYKDFTTKGDGLFTAISKADSKKYLLNNKMGIVANVPVMQQDEVLRLSNKNFVVYKKDINKLFFYSYDEKNGISKAAEFVKMELGIKINFIEKAFDKYYVVRVSDDNKKQYASYIYDTDGKLVVKSEDGLWMYKDGYLIKYLANDKGDKLYLGYYDADLKPYSIIKD